MSHQLRPIEILSVEDNLADAKMIEELFKTSKLRPNLNFVTDGNEALDYLHRRGPFAGAVRPDFIILDLNLPKKDGREVLKEVKQNEDLKCIPILILSTSNSPQEVHHCYQLNANCYFTKPSDLEEFDKTVRAIENCWLTLAKVPDYPQLDSFHRVPNA